MAEEGQFPPVQLDGITAPHGLRTWLRRKTLAEQDRAESVAAIWGYPADNGPALASALPPSVARCFGLDDLANELMSTEKGEINSGYVTSVESKVEPVRMKTAEPILVQQKRSKLSIPSKHVSFNWKTAYPTGYLKKFYSIRIQRNTSVTHWQ